MFSRISFVIGTVALFAPLICFNNAFPQYTPEKRAFDIKEEVQEWIDKLAPMDPLSLESQFLEFDSLEITGNMTMKNIVAKYFSKMKIVSAFLSIKKFQLEFDLPELEVTYDYWGDAVFYQFIPMYGNGTSRVDLKGATIGFESDVVAVITTDPISVKNTKLALKLEECNIDITGLLGSEDLGKIAEQALEDFIMNVVNDKVQLVNAKITPMLEKGINEFLVRQNVTADHILS